MLVVVGGEVIGVSVSCSCCGAAVECCPVRDNEQSG